MLERSDSLMFLFPRGLLKDLHTYRVVIIEMYWHATERRSSADGQKRSFWPVGWSVVLGGGARCKRSLDVLSVFTSDDYLTTPLLDD